MVSVGAHLRLISKIAGCEGKISRKEITDEGENAINYLDDLLSSCDVDCVEGKAMLCRIKRGIQELQHEIDKSENIEKSVNLQKLDALRSELEDERAVDSTCCDMKDSRSHPTSEVALEINLFPENDNHSSAGTDAVDSARINHLAQKFSLSNGQNEGPLPRNERKDCEAEGQDVSSIIRKFEKIASCSIPNLSIYENKHVQLARAPYVAKTFPAALSQDMKRDTFDVTASSTISKEEIVNKEKACSNPYLSTSANTKSLQFARAPYVAKEVPAVSFQDKKQDTTSALSKEEKGNKEQTCGNTYLSTSANRKSMQFARAPYVAKEVPVVSFQDKKQDTTSALSKEEKVNKETACSSLYLLTSVNTKSLQFSRTLHVAKEVPVLSFQDKKQDMTSALSKEEKGDKETACDNTYLSTSANRKSTQFARAPYVAKEVPVVSFQDKKQDTTSTLSKEEKFASCVIKRRDTFTTPTQEKGEMENESSKPYLSAFANRKSMQFPPSVAIHWVPTVPSQYKKHGTFDVIATPSNEKAKINSKFKAEDRTVAATQDKKQDTFASITTLHKEMPKKGNSEFKAKDEDEDDNLAGTKYVSRLVRRFEEWL